MKESTVSPQGQSLSPTQRANGPGAQGGLTERALEAIRAGRLPDRLPDATWGGRGQGDCCAICGASVRPSDAELEIEFARAESAIVDTHHVHAACFTAWERETRARAAAAAAVAESDEAPRVRGRAELQSPRRDPNIRVRGPEAPSSGESA